MNACYFFIIKAEPTPAALNEQDIDGANVNIWVCESNVTDAEATARAYILSYAWIPQEIRYAGKVTDELIESLDEVELQNYGEAIENGISAAFYGWTKEKLPPDFFEYRPLGPALDAGKERIN